MSIALLALATGVALTGNNCTDFGDCPADNSYDYTDWATQLRADLLADYDSGVPPKSNRTSTGNFHPNICDDDAAGLRHAGHAECDPSRFIIPGTRAGTDVGMQIVFYKLDAVDVPNGHMRIKCWLRMAWYDYRLRWNPADYGGIEHTYFRGASYTLPEDTEIWLPDVAVRPTETRAPNSPPHVVCARPAGRD